ncbi:MAG: hypothetical protein AB7V77_04910 [Candidatus Woesearchaeota archaeon]
MGNEPAKLCSSCGFGSKKDKCVVCDKSFAKNEGKLCRDCGFGSKKDKCAKCGGSFARETAHVCDSHKNVCARCKERL